MKVRIPSDLRFVLMSATESSVETECVVKLRELGYSAAVFDQIAKPDNRRQSWGRFEEGKRQMSGENPGSGSEGNEHVRSRSSRRLQLPSPESPETVPAYFTKYVELTSGCELRITVDDWLETCCRVGPFDITTDGQRRLLVTPEVALCPPLYFSKSYGKISVQAPCREFMWWTAFAGGSVMLVDDYALYEPLSVSLVNKYRRFRPTFVVAGPEFWTQLLIEIMQETRDTVDNGLRYELSMLQRRRERLNTKPYSSSHSDTSVDRLAEDSDRSSPTLSVMVPGNRPSDFAESYGKEDTTTFAGDPDILALIPFARLKQLRRAYVRVPVGKLSLVLAIEKIREILGGLVCLGMLIEDAEVETAAHRKPGSQGQGQLIWASEKCCLTAQELALLERVCQPIPASVFGGKPVTKSLRRGRNAPASSLLGFHAVGFTGWSRRRSVLDDAMLSLENTAGHHFKNLGQFSMMSRSPAQSTAKWTCSPSSLPARSWTEWLTGGPRQLPSIDAALHDLGYGYTSAASSAPASAVGSVYSRKNTPQSIGSDFSMAPNLREEANYNRSVLLSARALLRRLIRDAQEITPGIRRAELAPLYRAETLSADSVFPADGTAAESDLEALPAEERLLLRLERIAANKSRRSLSSSAIAAIGKALVLANPNLRSYNSAVPPPPPPKPEGLSPGRPAVPEYSRSQSVPSNFRRRSRTLVNQEIGEQWLVEFTFARCEVLESWSPFNSTRWLDTIEDGAEAVQKTVAKGVAGASALVRKALKDSQGAPRETRERRDSSEAAPASKPPARPPPNPRSPRSASARISSSRDAAMTTELLPLQPQQPTGRSSRVAYLHKAEAGVLDEELNALRGAMAALRSGMDAWAQRTAEKVARLHSTSDLSDEVKYAERRVRHAVRRLLSTVLNEWSIGLNRGGHETTADMLDDFVDTLTQSRLTSIDMLGADGARRHRSMSFHEEEGDAFQELCRHFPGLSEAAAAFPEGENPFRLSGVHGGPEMAELLLAVLLVVLALENVRFARHKASLADKFAKTPSLSETLAWLTLLRTQRRFADAGDVLDVEVRSLALCEAPPLTWLLQPETEEHASASLGDQSLIFTLDSILGAVLSKLSDPTSTIDWSLVGDINQSTLARRSPHWELVRVLQQLRYRLGASLGVDLDFSKPKRSLFSWHRPSADKFRSMPLYVPGARDPTGPELLSPARRSHARRRGFWTFVACFSLVVGFGIVWYWNQPNEEVDESSAWGRRRIPPSSRPAVRRPMGFAEGVWSSMLRA